MANPNPGDDLDIANPGDPDDPNVANPNPGDDADDPANNGNGGDDDVPVEVAGAVEEVTELARTGTGPVTNRVFGLALLLLGLGGLATVWNRRAVFGLG